MEILVSNPTEKFINLLNIINNNPGEMSDEFAISLGFTGIHDMMRYFNSRCRIFDIPARILYVKNKKVYLSVNKTNLKRVVRDHIYINDDELSDNVIDIIFENSRTQDKVNKIIELKIKDGKSVIYPINLGYLLGYKTIDNVRDSIYRAIYTINENHGGIRLKRSVVSDDQINFYSIYQFDV